MTRSKIRTSGAEGLTLSSTDVTVASGDLLFGTSGKGVNLGVTSNTDSNTLDDYEEGTHTVTPNSNLTLSSSHNVFKYTKVGRSVAFTGYTKVSSVSGSDTVSLSLPFTISANPPNGLSSAIGYVMTNNVNIGDAGMAVFAYVGRDYLNFYKVNDDAGWTGLINSDLASNDEIYFSITYTTDS